MAFIEKLNKKEDGSSYVMEEIQTVTDGIYAGYLEHDNVTSNTVKVYTGSMYTGDEITTFNLSTPLDASWKTYIKIFASVDQVYITYETAGDTVEAEDINILQNAITAAQEELDQYELSNDAEMSSLKGRVSTVETSKASETSVASRLLLKADKSDTYTKSEADARIEAVVGAAPEALDTLKEIAAALNNDADFAGTMTARLATKVDKAAGKGLSTEDYTTAEKTKLAGIEASAEVNNISDVNASLLTGSADTTLHYHTADRNRSNHTGTQTASTISDFAAAARAIVLTGLSTATNAVIGATDTILAAFGKLQAQVTANLATLTSHISNVSNPHSVTKDQVGLGNCDNTADAAKSVASAAKLTTARTITVSGDATGSVSFDGSSNSALALTVANSGVTAGTYTSLTVNAKGLVTAGANPTTQVAQGGTGATTAAGALTNLGLTATASEINTLDGITTTVTELNYCDGVTGNIQTQLNAKAPLASPALTGIPTAPTATTGTNTTQLATTAFVQQALSTAGYGDMMKAVYDADGDGIVDSAETAVQLQTARTIALSGGVTGTATSFNGSANITIPVTSVSASYLTGTAAVSTTGNAATATKLGTARTISLAGNASGSAAFDGSSNISIAVTMTGPITWGQLKGA